MVVGVLVADFYIFLKGRSCKAEIVWKNLCGETAGYNGCLIRFFEESLSTNWCSINLTSFVLSFCKGGFRIDFKEASFVKPIVDSWIIVAVPNFIVLFTAIGGLW